MFRRSLRYLGRKKTNSEYLHVSSTYVTIEYEEWLQNHQKNFIWKVTVLTVSGNADSFERGKTKERSKRYYYDSIKWVVTFPYVCRRISDPVRKIQTTVKIYWIVRFWHPMISMKTSDEFSTINIYVRNIKRHSNNHENFVLIVKAKIDTIWPHEHHYLSCCSPVAFESF